MSRARKEVGPCLQRQPQVTDDRIKGIDRKFKRVEIDFTDQAIGRVDQAIGKIDNIVQRTVQQGNLLAEPWSDSGPGSNRFHRR